MDSLDTMAFDQPIDIRARLRASQQRQVQIARLAAPADWQAELRAAIAHTRGPRTLWFSRADAKQFLQSFAIFFTAAMVFLS